MSLSENCHDFLVERIEDCCQIMRETNPEYAAIFARRKERAEQHDAIVGKLTEDDAGTLASIEMDGFCQTAAEQQFLYRQGYLDCVELLQILQIL